MTSWLLLWKEKWEILEVPKVARLKNKVPLLGLTIYLGKHIHLLDALTFMYALSAYCIPSTLLGIVESRH